MRHLCAVPLYLCTSVPLPKTVMISVQGKRVGEVRQAVVAVGLPESLPVGLPVGE